jgi:hypothetical protein
MTSPSHQTPRWEAGRYGSRGWLLLPGQRRAGLNFSPKTLDGLIRAFKIALMKIPSIPLFLAILTFSISTPAAPPSDQSINQLLQLTKVDKLVDSVFTQMDGMMKATIQQETKGKPLSAEEQAVMDKQQAKMVGIMKEELSWDKMKDLYVQVYRETFSQEEIDGLIAFYRTPVGQSFVSKQPELMKRTMTIMQQRMAPMMQRIQKMSEETASELQKAKAGNAPGPKAD